MGVFGVFFGCRGDVGFSGPLLWVCSGVVGFNAAVFLSPVRDVFRPASPSPAAVHEKVLWSSCKREKVRPAHEKWPKMGVLWRAGRVFSRIGRWKPRVGRTFSRVWAWTPRLVWHVLGLAAVCKPWRHPRRVLWVPEGVSEGGGAVAPANLRRPTGTPCAPSCGALWNTSADLHRSHTQRIQKRPGPWPRALPATQELR